MNQFAKKIEEITDNIKGSLIVIGLSDEIILNKLKMNSEIKEIDLLNYRGKSFEVKGGKAQFLSINDFRKRYKKKGVDYVIADIKDLKKFLNKFIRNNVYVNSQTTYLYGEKKDVNISKLVRDYETYGAKVYIEYFEDKFIITIDNTKSRENIATFINRVISDRVHFILDILGGL